MIPPARLTAALVATAFALGGLLLLSGCTTLGVSLTTDYGQFSYTLPELPELPEPTSSK